MGPTGRPVRRTQTLSHLDQGPTESGTDRRIFKILLALIRSQFQKFLSVLVRSGLPDLHL